MKILITGASGFVGSFAVEEALNKGYEVWAGVRTSSSKKYLSDPRIYFIDLAYSDPDKLKSQLQDVKATIGKWDVVAHIMGLTKCKQPDDFDRVNYRYTRNFIDALRSVDIVPDKFIYMSSLAAMGPGNPDTFEEIKYTDEPHPNTYYGKSKLKTENYLRTLNDFPYVILRPTGVYGPREKDYFVMLQTLQRRINPAIGFGEQYITFIYVKDLVDIVFKCIDKDVLHEAFFVADGDVWTTSAYTDLCKKLLGISFTIPLRVPCFLVKGICAMMEAGGRLIGKFPTLNNDKYNILATNNWKCDTEKLEQMLDFKAKYNLNKGLEECIAWYKQEKWL